MSAASRSGRLAVHFPAVAGRRLPNLAAMNLARESSMAKSFLFTLPSRSVPKV
jgi:hypothetical protein